MKVEVKLETKTSDTFCTALDLILNIFIEDFLTLEEHEQNEQKKTGEADLLGGNLRSSQQRQAESNIG